ncbi:MULTISPECIES: ferrochelatase [Bacillus cereus group]|uniref:Coproporphyrin III ferrochelatase 2 n=1 Tax=Bacillus thuringiensis subsp. konkukian (strain 97-27) TaxID=281309 RepID=CPFC2_BACHK|nr:MULTISPECIES: ferrochelatase [Bacillus cereus group]Q6HM28.1 RecName: Full=Coproporphyrin III ferrochelatase 2 [[Bacillus thuringiensis] serovar konkukian str. 97-27]AAT62227.1 ferrochelatase [[Bacillus thuringiensis] serovar konkukian str. 97-27]AJI36798.1 ferrochelatase [Bacillus thuringiensis]QKI23774.1 ferrochelatase [Bacillus thuringiensis]
MKKKKIGLLVMAYGTPDSLDEVEAYYTHIRHGRKPSEEALQDLIGRYKAIGGISPLAKITKEQAHKLTDSMNNMFTEYEFNCYLGLKHTAPFIEDAVEEMKRDGIEQAISIVLAPHYSTFSIKAYNERAIRLSEEIGGPVIEPIDQWYDEPKFISYWADQIKETFTKIEDNEKAVVIFSAHSLPEKIIAAGDPYVEQLQYTADLIAAAANIQNYTIGWQSAGNTSDSWIGPDVQDLTRDLFEEHRYESFIYCPVGFVAEHLEVLYDNDYECKVVTDELNAAYFRPTMPNAQSTFIDCLATIVSRKMKEIVDKELILNNN